MKLVSLLKRRLFLSTGLALLMAGTLIFAGCSSSSDSSSSSVPLSAPTNMALTATSGTLLVQYSRVEGIGAEGSEKYPTYEVSIGTQEDGSDRVVFSPEVEANDSRLVRFTITKEVTGNELGDIFVYPQLQDGKEYWIFVRSNFESSGYGYSDYAKLSAVPIPMPTEIETATYKVGDRRILVTWEAKEYEEYAVQIDGDCPINIRQTTQTVNNPNWWSTTNVVSGNNYVFTVDDNTEAHSICMTATNVNGNAPWTFFGDIIYQPDDNITVEYEPITAKPAQEEPDAPVASIARVANGRLEISFPAYVAGDKSVADYQYSVKPSNSSTWSPWESILVTTLTDIDAQGQGTATFPIANLTNDRSYEVKLLAVNTKAPTGVEGEPVEGTPVYTDLNFNNPDEYLSKANAEYIYAEDVPHSDFWRISETYKKGGRPSTDRLVRGKETALGNLYADAIQWYATEKGYAPDFSWLIGDMIITGIQQNQTITPKFLRAITNQDYVNDTVVIVTLKGSHLISALDYSLDLDNYPAVGTDNGYATTLFGQAAAVYRNGHYGGSGGTTYNGVWWGMPSKEARYTIQYLDYSLDEFNENFEDDDRCVAARDANDGEYDSVNDPFRCYLLSYEIASPTQGAPGEGSAMGYKRGKIKNGTLTINGAAIEPDELYYIATTKSIADAYYIAFLYGSVQDTGIPLVQAVAEYIYNTGSAGMQPTLDGRVKLEGGVPGDNSTDFSE